jgi:uncharacterized repeat protein (TIGR01451 family)
MKLGRKNVVALVAVTAALVVAVGAPLIARAGIGPFDLSLAKTHTGNFTVGQNGTFTYTLSQQSNGTNAQPTIAGDTLTVTDSLPAGLTFVSGGGTSMTCTNSGQVVTCQGAPTITPNGSATLTVVVGAGSAASPVVTNTASYTDSVSVDTVTSNNTATDTVTVLAASTSSSSAVSASPTPVFTAAAPRPAPTIPLAITLVGLLILVAAGYGWHKLSRRG